LTKFGVFWPIWVQLIGKTGKTRKESYGHATEHFLQECSTHRELRQMTWPQEESEQSKLWGSLERTAGFILAAGKTI
jgi:hypothetical protein